MTTLADKSLLSGGDNKPPMLEKHLYDSWKSIMELYMMNRPHGRMILVSVEKGPLVWPSITMDGVTRLKEYTELTPAEAIQADCDIKAINIILQGLPTEIYALQERECKLYDEFDKFTYKKGESLHEYYLRFTLLLNDMNIYKMPLEQFQVNTKFLNTLPDEWSKFVTDVKLVKGLAYYYQSLSASCTLGNNMNDNANEVRLMHERNSDPLALVASHQIKPITLSNSSTHLPKHSTSTTSFNISISTYGHLTSLNNIQPSIINTTFSNFIHPNDFQSNHSPPQRKAQQSKPKLYVGDIIVQTNPIVIPDSEETLALAEESRSKMLLKHKDNMMLEKKKQVDTTPIDYAAPNQLYKDFLTRFIQQTELSAEQAFWSQNYMNSSKPTLYIRPTNVEVPKEHSKFKHGFNTSYKKLKTPSC
ncbi:hypothetical protein Tco_1111293 [Tanacetum coccineum]|uniref:Uncharacterized protein n=1 Tax=Tanacetum coccineum TaxID=301880 RepID=A0ABQ5IMP5_9ASTR